MGFRNADKVFKSDLPKGLRFLATRLALRASDKDGSRIYLSIETMARDIGAHRTEVIRKLKEMRDLGLLVVETDVELYRELRLHPKVGDWLGLHEPTLFKMDISVLEQTVLSDEEVEAARRKREARSVRAKEAAAKRKAEAEQVARALPVTGSTGATGKPRTGSTGALEQVARVLKEQVARVLPNNYVLLEQVQNKEEEQNLRYSVSNELKKDFNSSLDIDAFDDIANALSPSEQPVIDVQAIKGDD